VPSAFRSTRTCIFLGEKRGLFKPNQPEGHDRRRHYCSVTSAFNRCGQDRGYTASHIIHWASEAVVTTIVCLPGPEANPRESEKSQYNYIIDLSLTSLRVGVLTLERRSSIRVYSESVSCLKERSRGEAF
jgi:hypothetical protein